MDAEPKHIGAPGSPHSNITSPRLHSSFRSVISHIYCCCSSLCTAWLGSIVLGPVAGILEPSLVLLSFTPLGGGVSEGVCGAWLLLELISNKLTFTSSQLSTALAPGMQAVQAKIDSLME